MELLSSLLSGKSAYSIHWEYLDEYLSTEGILRGAPAPKKSKAIS